MPEISFPTATDTPPRTDYTAAAPWVDPVNGGSWLWDATLAFWAPVAVGINADALDVGAYPNTLTITGVTTPAASDPLLLTLGGVSVDGDGNATQWWHAGAPGSFDTSVRVVGTFGVWTITMGAWPSYTYEATKISSAKTPVGLTDWTIITGAGQPILGGNPNVASYIGQLGTSYPTSAFGVDGPPWFRWDGTRWQEDAGASTAADVSYDNTTSGLAADDVQAAIDEITTEKAPLVSPSFTTPALGVATVTTINNLIITPTASSNTLTLFNDSVLTTGGDFSTAADFATTGSSPVTLAMPSTGAKTYTFPAATATLAALTDITATNFTGTLPVAKGGTGNTAASVGTGGVLLGNQAVSTTSNVEFATGTFTRFGLALSNDKVLFGSDKSALSATKGFVVGIDHGYFFNASYAWNGSPDTGISRNASGVVEINNGTAGTLRDLSLRNLTASGTIKPGAFTVGTTPTGVTGAQILITDALTPAIGSTAVTGGTKLVQCTYNGTAWQVTAILT